MPLMSHDHDMAGMPGLPARSRAKQRQIWPDLSIKEVLTLLPLAVLTIYLGVYPQAVLNIVEPALQRILAWCAVMEAGERSRLGRRRLDAR